MGPAADGAGEGLAPMSLQPMFPGRFPALPLGVMEGTKSDNEGTPPTAEAEDSMKISFCDGELDGTQVTNLKRIQTQQVQRLRERPSTQHEVRRPFPPQARTGGLGRRAGA